MTAEGMIAVPGLPAVIGRRYRRDRVLAHARRYRGRAGTVGLATGSGVGLTRRGERLGLGRGVGVGISAASLGLTGSARRTSGSADADSGTKGVTLGRTV